MSDGYTDHSITEKGFWMNYEDYLYDKFWREIGFSYVNQVSKEVYEERFQEWKNKLPKT